MSYDTIIKKTANTIDKEFPIEVSQLVRIKKICKNYPNNDRTQSRNKLLNEIGIVIEIKRSERAGEEATIVLMTFTESRREVKACEV